MTLFGSALKRVPIILCTAILAAAGVLLGAALLQAPSGAWVAAGPMNAARSSAAGVLLLDGRILVTGGSGANGPANSAELFAADGTFSLAAPMNVPRSGHVAVVLQDGRVLVAGGTTSGGVVTNTAEIYDPVKSTWTNVTGGMVEARTGQTVAVLKDGRVVIAGGQNGNAISATIEIFNATVGKFTSAGMMSSARTQHAMTVLQDGRVLMVGGNNGTAPVGTTDIFDPVAGTVGAGPKLSVARYGHSATTLLNGQVVVIGGNNGNADPAQMDVTPVEMFDPAAATPAFITLASNLGTPREGHLAFLLPNNNSVLIVGGTTGGTSGSTTSGTTGGSTLASAELFTPKQSTQGVWTYAFGPTGSMSAARSSASGAANQVSTPSSVMQRNGVLLVAGGKDATGNALNTSEAYGFATVQTDQGDYPPGTTVTITGSGWQAGEKVQLQLVESPLIDTHGPYTVTADANGTISDHSFSTDAHDLNVRFTLTAIGSVSRAQMTFTDAGTTNVTLNNTNTIAAAFGRSSLSAPMTVNAGGSNTIAFATVWVDEGSGASGTTFNVTATYGGRAMTSAGATAYDYNYAPMSAQVFYLVNPPTGTNTLAVNATASSGTIQEVVANLVSYNGVNQTAPVRPGTYQTLHSANGITVGNFTATLTSNASDLTLDTVEATYTFASPASNQTVDGTASAYFKVGSDHATTAAASVADTWSFTNPWAYYAYAGFSIQAASAAPTLQSIAVTPASPSSAKGATQQFVATGTYSDGSTQTITTSVTWASSTTSVATITSGGLATGVAVGTSNITASLGAATSPVDMLTVTATLQSIAVTPVNPSIAKGKTQQFVATATYTDGSTLVITNTVTWASATTSVATIASGGLATGVGIGTSNITASLNGVTSPADVLTVTAATLQSIAVTPANPSIVMGLTQQFVATGTYSDSSTQTITSSVVWASAATSVATITSGGLATGLKIGTSNITASLSGVTSPADVLTVTASLQSITVTPSSPTIAKTATQQFVAMGTYSDGSTQTITTGVTWASSAPLVATITSAGLATGVGAGTSNITATLGSVTSPADVLAVTTSVSVTLNNTNTIVPAFGKSSLSAPMSVTAGGSNTVAFALVWVDEGSGASGTTFNVTATYGGQAMTSAGAPSYDYNYAPLSSRVFYLVNPPTGTNTLVVNATSSAGTIQEIIANLISFNGVDQATPVRPGTYQALHSANGITVASFTAALASNTSDLTLGTVEATYTFSSPASSQTVDGTNAAYFKIGSDHATTAATAIADTWSFTNPYAYYAYAGFSIQAATAAPTLTYTATAASRSYGATNPTFTGTVTGFVGSDTQANSTTGTLIFTSSATTTSNVGSYAINGSGLTANGGKYTFAQAATNATALTITKATPTVTVTSGTFSYDGNPHGATATAVGVDGVTAVSGTFSFAYTPPGNSTVPVSAGTYSVTANFTSTDPNYNNATGSGSITITSAATLTYTATPASRSYGATNPTFTGTVTGFIGTDTQANSTTGTLIFTSSATTTSNVGSYAINGSGLTANGGKYTFAQAATNATALTITKATPTVTVTGGTFSYDGNPHGATATAVGVDGVTAVSGTFSFTYTPPGNSTVPVSAGTYSVTANFTSTDPNYNNATGSGSITITSAATLTYTATPASRNYGAANPTFTGTVTGFVGSDTQANSTTGNLAFTSSATTTSNVGSYAINGSGLTANGGKYTFAQAATNATALTITKATPTVTVTGGTFSYDGNPHGATATAVGVDGVTAVSGTFSFTYTPPGNSTVPVSAGTYSVTANFTSTDPNYNNATGSGSITITSAATLTYTATPASRNYGAANPTFTGTVTGFVGSDTQANSTTGNLAFTSAAAAASNAGSYAINGSGLSATNYTFVQASSNATALTITKATPTVTVAGGTFTYDGNSHAGTATAVGVDGHTAVSGSFSFTFTPPGNSTAPTNVGTYSVIASFSSSNANYSNASGSSSITIEPAIAPGPGVYQFQAYNSSNTSSAPFAMATQTNDMILVYGSTQLDTASFTGVPTLSDGTTMTQCALAACNFTTSDSTLNTAVWTGISSGGTKPSFTLNATGPATSIGGIGIEIAGANTLDRIASGEMLSDTTSDGTGTVISPTITTTQPNEILICLASEAVPLVGGTPFVSVQSPWTGVAFGNQAVAYTIAGSPGIYSCTMNLGNGTQNYSVTIASFYYSSNVIASLNTSVTYSASAQSASLSATVTSATGPVNTGSVTFAVKDGTTTIGTATSMNVNNGSVSVNYPLPGHTAVKLYTIQATYNPGSGTIVTDTTHSLTVNPSSLAVTGIIVNSKVYDATTAAILNMGGAVLVGVGNGDDVRLDTSTFTANFSDKNVANSKAVTIAGLGLIGLSSGNYALTQPTGLTGTITPAMLTYTADAISRSYGGASPTFTGTVTGFVGTDTQANATTGTLTFNSPATSSSNVGKYSINGSGLTSSSGNYNFLQAVGNSAALTIAPATLTYVADPVSRSYGAANPTFTGKVTGFVGSDTQTNSTTGTLTFTSTATTSSSVGTYAVYGSGLSASNGNYSFVQAPGNSSALTITPAATLIYTANAAGRTYGTSNPLFTGTVTGFVGSDTQANATTGTLTFTSTATVSSNIGNYAINGSGLNAANYIFVQAAANATALTIAPATLTYVANSTSRNYGAGNPSFSGTLIGFAGSDTQMNATTGTLTFTSATTTSSNAGSYAVNGSGLTANNGNYSFAQALGNATALMIAPATLTYTANAGSRGYGATNPTFVGTVTGFVGTDTQLNATTGTLAFTSTATTSSNAGSYAINGSGLTASSSNYVFIQAPGNASALTISPATLTYAANSATRSYGTANQVFTGTVTGFVGTDTFANATTGTLVFTSSAVLASNIGNYAINGSGLTANHGNYILVQALTNAFALTVTPGTLTYTASAVTRPYGIANPIFAGTVTGFLGADTQSNATMGTLQFTTVAITSSTAGSYPVNGSGLTSNNGNYIFVQAASNATALTIMPVTQYYLATSGNDSNNGLSSSTPWLTPNHAVNCGDVIIAAASTSYSGANFTQGKWGTVTCPSGNDVAWLKCATFDACKITNTTSGAIWVDRPYWGVQGWEINGSNNSTCFAASASSINSVEVHHVIFANDIATSCGSGSFATTNLYKSTTVSSDYIAIVGTISYSAAANSTTCGNAISIYQPILSDSLPGTHIYIAGNFTYDNVEYFRCNQRSPTDGEGIILDTFNGSGGGITPYAGQTVVENNISLFNGAPGIWVLQDSAGSIYIRQNTTYGNNTDRRQGGYCAEIGANTVTGNVYISGNITATTSATTCNGSTWWDYILSASSTAVQLTSGVAYSPVGNRCEAINGGSFLCSAASLSTTNPSFLSPSNPASPSCGSAASVAGCMATVISNFRPTASGTSSYGYQVPSLTPNFDPLFPQWLCNVNLPPDLVTMGCN